MTGYSLKGIISFWLIVGAIIFSVLTGDFLEAGNLIVYLIGGMITYQVGRYIVRIVTGWDPDDGTFRSDREIDTPLQYNQKELEVYRNGEPVSPLESFLLGK